MSGSEAQRERAAADAAEAAVTETGAKPVAARALASFQRFGRTAIAFRALGPDLAHWMPPGMDAVVGYAAPTGALVAAGEPLAAPHDLVPAAESFLDFAEQAGRRASFFATEGRLGHSLRLRRWLIGEQPVWNPQEWAMHMAHHRSLREQVRRARAKGVVTQHLPHEVLERPAVREAVAVLVARWRATRSMAPMRFLVTVDLVSAGTHRRHVVAWHQGRLAALLSLAPVPARGGWVFEHLLRDPDAPNGTLELLVDHTMRALAGDGVSWATLGLAPLHGEVAPWLRRIRRWSTPLFNFEGLSAFKRKLRPAVWEPIYLAWPATGSGLRALLDGLRAFAGGSLWRFGVRTVLRGPAPLLRALEWLLIPWTIMLALAPTSPWFPAVWVHAAWVTFDGALLMALRHVRRTGEQHGDASRRRTARLATGVAVAVSVDALLTALQAMRWNLPAAPTLLDTAIVLVACIAPATAAVVLWGAARRYRTLARARPTVTALQFPS
ncbi:phosphatidylglycerol lysyltransferase domain-containing protein [Gemmatimonas sp.]